MGTFSKVKVLTAASSAPLSVSTAKLLMNVEHSDDDTLIGMLIDSATQYCERYLQTSIVRQQKRVYFDVFADEFYLPQGPAKEIVQMQYLDGDGAEQTVNSSLYSFNNFEPYVRRAYSAIWPAQRYVQNAVWIDYWAGYYDEAASPVDVTADVPPAIRDAITMIVLDIYEHREAQSEIELYRNRAADMLLDSFREYRE